MAAISHFVMAQFLLNQKTAVAPTKQNPIQYPGSSLADFE
jgi:hypothetical protein